MLYTENLCKQRNNSTQGATPAERNTVSIEKFNIEKDAKNRAYAFILSCNLLEEFRRFCALTQQENPFQLIKNILAQE